MFNVILLGRTYVIWRKFSIIKVWLFLLLNHRVSYIISYTVIFSLVNVFVCGMIILISAPKLEVSMFEILCILQTIVSSLTYLSFRQDHWIKGISTATLNSLNSSTVGSSRLSNVKVVFPGIFDHFKSLNLIICIYWIQILFAGFFDELLSIWNVWHSFIAT